MIGRYYCSNWGGFSLHVKTKAFKAALPKTIPILAGFIFLGFAFGILMNSKGYSPGWSILMSVFIYAGAMQFVAVNLLTAAFNPLNAFIITLVINARHLFYGVSMLEKYSGAGKKKPYLIFGIVDETFSVLCSTEPPAGVDKYWFMFFVTLLDHIFWVTGTALGAVFGATVAFDTKGIDFVMTALFVVIFINQWKSQQQHSPALVGLVASAFCLLVFGAKSFIIPAMMLIIVVMILFRKPIEKGMEI
jgi:4-azaleucine resistance transporter AzlC